MIEVFGDLWQARRPGDWVCITINSFIRSDGCLVMGRGIALEASRKYPYLQQELGDLVRTNGSQLEVLPDDQLIAFPVKRHFRDKADLQIILRSTIQLLDAAQRIQGRILMPRPGAGYGRLDWLEVKPMLAHYLTDDRFVVFHK